MSVDRSQSSRTRWQFSVKALLVFVTLVACVLAVNRWLGPPYGWLTAIPLAIIELVGLSTRWRSMIGCVVGFLLLSLIGYYFVIGFGKSDPRFLKAMITLGAYGGSAGASIHAIVIGRWIVGSLWLIATLTIFAAILTIQIPS